MINLRYHIVSLTAVFLAIGIGLTLGSTFLDRATVENLNGQLESLDTRLKDREERIQDLEGEVDSRAARQTALDEQAAGLLGARLTGVPVVVVTARGADEDDVQQTVAALVVADADVQGIWWMTERWSLDDEAAINDLATALDEDSTDPSRLRRTAITRLGGEMRVRQLLPIEGEDAAGDVGEGGEGDPGATSTETTETTQDTETTGGAEGTDEPSDGGPATAGADVEVLLALVEAGFIEFEAVAGGPDAAALPDGTRVVFGAGSAEVPDDLVIEPLIGRMGRSEDTPVYGVVGSVMSGDGEIADAVTVVRDDEELRLVMPSVDTLEHFEGRAAMVLALEEVTAGIVGHYGLADSASRLLPPLRSP